MILLVAVAIGLVSGLLRAAVNKRDYRFYDLRYSILVLVAFLPQLFVFLVPTTSIKISDSLASILLILSLVLLLLFAVLNIKKWMFWPISAGFLANALVITLNDGFMPISPETIEKLRPEGSTFTYQIGQRLGTGKDIVLNQKDTLLAFLSDRLILPDFLHSSIAFSVGDVLIAVGVIWLLWSMGGPARDSKEEKNEQLL
jgi:hypothetical protein